MSIVIGGSSSGVTTSSTSTSTGSCNDGCTGGCSSTCAKNCAGACASSTCTGGCNTTCKSGCSSTSGLCGTGCGSSCGDNCAKVCVDCGSACSSSCSGGCSTGCTGCDGCSGCGSSCSSGCSGTCKSGCKTTCSGCSGTCSSACASGCGSNCQGVCSGCSHGCAVVANSDAYNLLLEGLGTIILSDKARALRDLLMEEVWRRLSATPDMKYTTTVASGQTTFTIDTNFNVKSIVCIYNVSGTTRTQITNYSLSGKVVTIAGLTEGTTVEISYITTIENVGMEVLYETAQEYYNNIHNIYSTVSSEISRYDMMKKSIAKDYLDVAVALYREVLDEDTYPAPTSN